MPTALLSGSAAAGGIAAISTFGSLGAFVTPLIIGHITDGGHSFARGAVFYGLMLICGSVALLLGTKGIQRSNH